MPNYCDCDLQIFGKSGVLDVLEFIKDKDYPFDFDKVIPYPEEFKALDNLGQEWDKEAELHRKSNWDDWIKTHPRIKDGFNTGGYEWRISNWGTKWSARQAKLVGIPTNESAFLNFLTPWTPPTPIILALSEKFPGIIFELHYFEGGGGFKGVYFCKNGKVLKENVDSYSGERGG